MGLKTILNLVLYILGIFIAVKCIKNIKYLKQIKNKYNTYSEEVKKKKKFSNLSFMVLGLICGLMIASMFNMLLTSNETLIVIKLITMSTIISECLYMIFIKKSNINPNIYKYHKKTVYWLFSLGNIGLLLEIIDCIHSL